LIGHKGEALKQVGIAARKDLEKFFSKKIYLGLHVRIKENWRDNSQFLQQLGYHAK
jgi:GTP-binding protein Era